MKYELIATSTFGIEAVVRREIEKLGLQVLKTEDGKVTYIGDERGIINSNLWLRTADRVYIKMGEFEAGEFEELFQQVKGIPWENIIPPAGKFTVVGTSVKSKLHSVPACQSICKKAIAKRLGETYSLEELPENGAEYKIRFSILKDKVTISIDTSGAGLHKRGYRISNVKAPIKETLAAAMVDLSFWKPGRELVDPCCGSGTIAIEAAMIGRNIAPGLSRSFACEEWDIIDKSLWKEEKSKAYKAIDYDADVRIFGFDISKSAILASRENAEEAGVDDCIVFKHMNITTLEAREKSGIIITNPPYGERIGEEREIQVIYNKYRDFFKENPTWSLYMITPDKNVESEIFGHPANKRRKLYNGRIEVCLYQFFGEKVKK